MSKLGHTIYLAVIGILVILVVRLAYNAPENTDQVGDIRVDPATLAILPFVSVSPDESAVRLADQVTADIVDALAQVPHLKVAARSSTRAFIKSNLGPSAIGKKLAVSRVLEGAVRIDQDRVQVTAQLIDVASEAHLWSETYDRNIGDLDAIVAEIAERVTNYWHDQR